ncbi:MAG: PIN domain-containing protein [Nitrospirota bacterium]
MKGGKVFLDTNIVIYAYDVSAGDKHRITEDIIDGLWRSGGGITSVQVLTEFFVTITTKIPKPMDKKAAREIVRDFLKWDVVVNDGESVLKAIDIHTRYQYSFWDSMIIQAAIKGNATVLLSEDLSDGQVINGLKIKNPFV